MQTKKESVRTELLRAARSTFVAGGFKGTSMRAIAAAAGVSLSNIYNYFDHKDQLFAAVLRSAMAAMERLFEAYGDDGGLSFDLVGSDGPPRQLIRDVTDLVVKHREGLELLLLRAHGSELEGYREALIERHTRASLDYVRRLKREHPEINDNISEFFVHNLSSWWINTTCELVMHELPRDEVERFVARFTAFGTAGWRRLLEIR
ncbi:MAG: hypothetical protein CSA66_03825 [Proteobacteria bacterium]|nr:MAG: hypothetical protein CSA66_03825 [Pseudomonadota bacterium]